jgi:hypothetical protein
MVLAAGAAAFVAMAWLMMTTSLRPLVVAVPAGHVVFQAIRRDAPLRADVGKPPSMATFDPATYVTTAAPAPVLAAAVAPVPSCMPVTWAGGEAMPAARSP